MIEEQSCNKLNIDNSS